MVKVVSSVYYEVYFYAIELVIKKAVNQLIIQYL